MKNHILSVHEGQKPFQCDICNVGFKENFKLKRHVVEVHEKIKRPKPPPKPKPPKPIEPIDKEKYPFQCPHCNRGFKVKWF